MRLPDSALQKLAVEFRAANGHPRPTFRGSHTLPIRRDRWNAYAEPLDTLVHEFNGTVAQSGDLHVDFMRTRSWLTRITEIRRQIILVLLALAPFSYFDADRAARLLDEIEMTVREVADAVEQRRRPDAEPVATNGVEDIWGSSQSRV